MSTCYSIVDFLSFFWAEFIKNERHQSSYLIMMIYLTFVRFFISSINLSTVLFLVLTWRFCVHLLFLVKLKRVITIIVFPSYSESSFISSACLSLRVKKKWKKKTWFSRNNGVFSVVETGNICAIERFKWKMANLSFSVFTTVTLYLRLI